MTCPTCGRPHLTEHPHVHRSRHDPDCSFPLPHRHRAPTESEVAEARYSVEVEHPLTCAWRHDIYSGCSCGVTGLVMQLEDVMRGRSR